MYKNKKILAIIPARGGSKGIKNKNIKPMNGKPLIVWTIEAAQQSIYLDKFLVSTDSKEIAKVAKHNGAEVPFLRLSKYAKDDSPSYEAVLHAIDQLKLKGETYDYVALLEPTSPLRGYKDIDNAIAQLIYHPDADGLVSV